MEINFATFFLQRLCWKPEVFRFLWFEILFSFQVLALALYFSEKKTGENGKAELSAHFKWTAQGFAKRRKTLEKSSFDSLFLVIFIREKLHLQIDFTSICCRKPLRVLMIGSELSMMQWQGQFTMVPCRLQIMRSTVRILNACTWASLKKGAQRRCQCHGRSGVVDLGWVFFKIISHPSNGSCDIRWCDTWQMATKEMKYLGCVFF